MRTLAASCEWGDLKDDLIFSRIVSGISSKIVREQLLRGSDLKLDKAVEICRTDELSKQQMKLFGSESGNVNLVKCGGAYRVKNKTGKADKTQEAKKDTEGKQENKRNACGNYGLIHTKGQCLAYGKQCNKCKKMYHYARMCRSSKSVNSCQQQPGKSDDYLFLETVKVESVDQIRQSETEYITFSLNKEDIQLKLDIGAEVNVIPYSTYRKVAKTSKIELRKPKARLSAYNGKNIPIKAVCTLLCQHKGTIHNLDFFSQA